MGIIVSIVWLYFFRCLNVKLEVHQDDFHACSPLWESMQKLKEIVSKHLLMKFSDIFGLEGEYSHLKCLRIKTRQGIWLLGHEKHTDKILKLCDLEGCKSAPTPITVSRKLEDEKEAPCGAEEQKVFRSCVGVGRCPSAHGRRPHQAPGGQVSVVTGKGQDESGVA